MRHLILFRTVAVPVCFFCLTPPTAAQTYEPSVEYASLLSMGFYDRSGAFMVDKLQLVFPPADDQPVEFQINKPGGETVVSLPMRIERWNGQPAFAGLRAPSGHPGTISLEQGGDYEIAITVGGKVATKMPFSMKVESSGDPFNPQKSFTREGPWRTLGFLGENIDQKGGPLLFYWWSSPRELAEGKTNGRLSVHIMKDGDEIAYGQKAVSISGSKWRFLQVPFEHKVGNGEKAFTLEKLRANDGVYEVVVKDKDTVVKTFKAKVKDGELKRLKRNKLGLEPHEDFISPRLKDMRDGYGGRNFMVDAYWVSTER